MLEGILGRGFASKCKSLIKLTKSRIDVIRRKRNATQKFLKKDMADLLANGLDVNAYGRADGLLAELILSSCYDFVEHCCDFLLKNLSLMQKQSECPEECREAVSSLMCAAARFSDLPELRDLRHAFHERYGNSLDYCLNRQFAENLAPKPFTMERKVLLMEDIASEFSIKWNAQEFEQRMSKRLAHDQGNPKDDALSHLADVHYKAPSGKEVSARGVDLEFPAIKASNNDRRIQKGSEANNLKRNEVDHPPQWDNYSDNAMVREEWDVPITRRNQFDTPQRGKQESRSERKIKEGGDPKMMRPDLFPQGNEDGYSDNGKNHRGRDKNALERGNMDAPLAMKPRYVDHSAANSSKSQVKVPSSVSAGEKLGTPSHVRPGYPDNIAASSSTAAVKNHSANTPLARVKSEGDRSYFEKSEMKEESSLNTEEKLHILRHARPGNHSSTKSVERVKSEGGRTFLNGTLPPPYVKPNVKAKDVSHRGDPAVAPSRPNFNGIPMSPALHGNASSDQGHKDVKIPLYSEKAREDAGTARGDTPVDGKDRVKHLNEENGIPLPKPSSSRRRHSKSRSAHDGARDHDVDAEGAKRSSRSRRHDSRKGLQILFDDERHQKDDEERMIDKLLIHYSKKPTTYEGERVKRKLTSRHHDPNAGISPQNRTERAEEFGAIAATPRSVSLPHEQPSAPPQPAKVFTRAATFQADRSKEAKHVHPKLPDYDDLAARFAALKGR